MKRLTTAATVVFLLTSGVGAQVPDYFIQCTIETSYDFSTGRTEPTTGSDEFGVTKLADGTTTYSLPFPCDEGTETSRISDEEMFFTCTWHLQGAAWNRFAPIDRVSAA